MIEEKNLGVVLVASPFDWLFAKGAIASCRYFMPESPIQLIVDGIIDTGKVEKTYDAAVIRKCDIEHAELSRLGFGWGTTKLLAFWKAQTDEFLYLDSDAVLWGDLSSKLKMTGIDYLASIRKCKALDRETVENWFFDTAFVEQYFPDWDWLTASSRFFCPGVFAARKGAFELEEYLNILRLNEKYPGKFKFGDMGFHNLMVFRGADRGTLRVEARDFQVIFPEHSQHSLRARFAFDSNGAPIVIKGDEQVLHMPDQKPLVDNPNCYSLPMTYFRLKFLQDTEGISGEAAMLRLRAEDAEYHQLRKQFLRREKQQKLINLLKGHPGEWRRLSSRLATKLGFR